MDINKYKKVLSFSLLALLLMITIGFSYAIFTFGKVGTTENAIHSGTVTIVYTEISELQLENAFPVSDEVGKALTGEGNVFSFTVTGKVTGDYPITYEVAARAKEGNTLRNDEIKLYLECNDKEVLEPSHYEPLTAKTVVGSPEGSMIIDSGVITDTIDNHYILKMWVDEDTIVTDEVKYYTITVDVYAKDGIYVRDRYKKFDIADEFNLFLTTKGELYGMGRNNYGQLGLNDTADRNIPVKIADDVIDFARGDYHSLFIKRNGDLYAMGRNYYGQLGDGTNQDKKEPVKVFEHVKSVDAYKTASMFITEDGKVYAMGNGYYGTLGTGNTANSNVPIETYTDIPNIVQVDVSDGRSFVLTKEGVAYGVGYNKNGELGQGNNITQQLTPVKIMENVRKIGGSQSSYFLTNDKELYGTGRNDYGQLGIGSTNSINVPQKLLDDVVDFDAMGSQTVAIKSNGELYVAGNNAFAGLGLPGKPEKTTSWTKVMDNATKAYVGGWCIYVTTADGKLYVSGKNEYGKLGIGSDAKNQEGFLDVTSIFP